MIRGVGTKDKCHSMFFYFNTNYDVMNLQFTYLDTVVGESKTG